MLLRFLSIFLLLSAPAAFAAEVRPVSIHSGGHTHTLRLEVAQTEQQQQKGLMFRETLPEDGGMLFLYSPPRPVYMWMRNTLIPLDMIFVREDGTIAHIERNAAPHSENPRGIHAYVAAVLELPGGTAARLGIALGDRVDYPAPTFN